MERKPKVVIVGGGFGGLWAAKALANKPVEVMLIDRKNHHVFQPLLYQVATAVLSPGEIAHPIRRILHDAKNIEVIFGEVVGFDAANNTVRLDDGVGRSVRLSDRCRRSPARIFRSRRLGSFRTGTQRRSKMLSKSVAAFCSHSSLPSATHI